MEMSNSRKALYIVISVFSALVLWFYVNNSADVDISIDDIPVEFFNSESALANKGLMLISGNDATVDLVISMPRSMVFGFDPSRVRLLADLNSINSTGTQSLSYSIIYPPGVSASQVSVKSPTVRTVSVRVGELFRKNDVEIRCKLVGNVASGYVAGRVKTLPEVLEVWGQQSDVMQVSYAQVTLNISNARSTIVEQIEFELYDEDDKLIESSSIHAASDTIQVTMPVISATDIPLVVNFTEEPGVRISSFDYSLEPSSVTLSGDANEIGALKELVLGEIVLSEIEGTQTFTYDIQIPDGLTNLSGITTATLTITNRDIGLLPVTVTSFAYENFSDAERRVEVVTSSLNVVLRAASEVLSSISENQITAIADLTGIADASGTYTVPAVIQIEGEPDFGTTESYQLTVRISTPEPDDTENDQSIGDAEE